MSPTGGTRLDVWVALTVPVLIAVAVSARAGLGVGGQVLRAGAGALAQLTAVSAMIVAVARSLWLAWLFILLMYGAATWTSARRISRERTALRTALPIVIGTPPVLPVLLGSGAVPLTGIAVIPAAGIVLGGSMTTTSMAARLAVDGLANRYDEYEAWLALGMRPRQAALLFCRPAGRQALVPPLDQTRTIGLVTLPGAFVGLLLGSGNAVQAGAAQLLVLIGLARAEVLAVNATIELVAGAAPPEQATTAYTRAVHGGTRGRWRALGPYEPRAFFTKRLDRVGP